MLNIGWMWGSCIPIVLQMAGLLKKANSNFYFRICFYDKQNDLSVLASC
jgi:hypothetical protein